MIRLLAVLFLLSFGLMAKKLPKHAVNPVNLHLATCMKFSNHKTVKKIKDELTLLGVSIEDLETHEGFDLANLNAIVTALSVYPESLLESISFKIDKSPIKSPARYEDKTILIKPKYFFKKYNLNQRIAILIHEIAHSISYKLNMLDRADDWFSIEGGWYYNTRMSVRADGSVYSGVPKDKSKMVSRRSMSGPGEDFAESVSLYRIEPKLLKSISLKKYNYIKQNVFANQEYLQRCNEEHE